MYKTKYVPFTKLIPNTITLCSLCFGVLSVYHSTMMHWEKACFFIIAAAIFDTLDGRFARIFNAGSDFGANLDSLCDFVNYTVFPTIIMYNWSLWNHGMFGWYAVMISSLCGAIRLARFNSQDKHIQHPIKKRFFHGLPSPAAGILIILPLMVQFSFENILGYKSIQYPPFYLYEIYISIIAIAMVSNIPTLSLKYIKIPKQNTGFAIVITGLIIISFFVLKFQAVIFYSILYIAISPFVVLRYCILMKKHQGKPNVQ